MSAMNSFGTKFSYLSAGKALLALPLCAVIAFASTTSATKADPFTSGVAGAIGGAMIGGAMKGKKGVGTGAAIGFGVGVLAGAAAEEEKKRKRRAAIAAKKRRAAAAKKRRAQQAAYARSQQQYVAQPTSVGPAYDDALVYETQLQLQRLGYNPGPVDGAYGPQTADAIATYQDDYALPVTGEPTPDLLSHMGQHGG